MYNKDINNIYKKLNTSEKGLTINEVNKRLNIYDKNIISPGTKVLVSAISILPFLFTLQVEASYFFNPSITEFAFSSWIKPVIAFIKTTTNITIVSVYSWEYSTPYI